MSENPTVYQMFAYLFGDTPEQVDQLFEKPNKDPQEALAESAVRSLEKHYDEIILKAFSEGFS